MSETLLDTKLHIPRLRRDLVHRPRLLERLDTGLRKKLTLVSAPAGFGKSTLVSEWVRYRNRPAAWLSLDKDDNDLTRFLIYFIAALQCIDAAIGVNIQSALSDSQSPPYDTLLAKLVNHIQEIQGEFTIVLDDYHLINAKSVHDSLNFLVEYLPQAMNLVIVGRADPPLPISRLRAQGEVTEIRTPELRFTSDEVTTLLNDILGFGLTPEYIAALDERTEGWIASLQLAALSLEGRQDKHAFIAAFSGSHRHIIDYLVDEVMASQPEEIQIFLLQTSILNRFCAPLCDTALGLTTSRQILAGLEVDNLFLIPLDDLRHWYRYHHLFADFLVQRLREAEHEHIPELHRRASQWFANEGLLDEAIHHALAAEDMERATRLVERIAPDLVVRRESNKLLKLVNQLPPDRCQDYPMLCIWHAWALLFLGQLDAVEDRLKIAESNQSKAPGFPIPGYVTTVRAYLSNQRGGFLEAIALSEQALKLMPDSPPDRITNIFRGAAVIWLGVNHRLLGDLEVANRLFTEAASLNQQAGNIYAALASFEQSAELAALRGQLHQAIEIQQRGLQIAQSWADEGGRGLGASVAASGLYLQLGIILYQWNDLAGAAQHIQRAVELHELGEVWGRVHSYKMLAYIKQAEGDFKASYDLLGKVYAISDSISVHHANISALPSLEKLGIILSRAHPEMAHLLTDAARRIETQGIKPNDEIDYSSPEGYSHESKYSDLARVLIEQGRAGEALPLFKRLLEAARSMGRDGDEIHYLILRALANQSLGDKTAALNSLSQALTLARPEGYLRIFVDEGQPMAIMLTHAVSLGIAPDYAAELLAAFPAEVMDSFEPEMELSFSFQPLAEPISERELDVLRLLAAGLKYKEAAEELVVSVNTVRHHTRNIYGKLEVNNRAQAIARARELGLI